MLDTTRVRGDARRVRWWWFGPLALATACPRPDPPTVLTLLSGERTQQRLSDTEWVPWFDAASRPVVRVEPADHDWRIEVDGEAIAEPKLEREESALELTLSDDLTPGAHHLEVLRGDRVVARWTFRWAKAPSRLSAIMTARAKREGGDESGGLLALGRAATSTDGWTATWAAVERAAWLRDSADTDRAAAAADEAGDVAHRCGYVTEAAARYRAAAYHAITRGRYEDAFASLLRAQGVSRGVVDRIGLGRLRYLLGVLALHLGRYRTAENELTSALELAEAARRRDDATQFSEYLAVLYTLLGRYDDARRTLSRHPASPDAPSHVRAGNLANRGWALAHQALAQGDDTEEARRLLAAARALYCSAPEIRIKISEQPIRLYGPTCPQAQADPR